MYLLRELRSHLISLRALQVRADAPAWNARARGKTPPPRGWGASPPSAPAAPGLRYRPGPSQPRVSPNLQPQWASEGRTSSTGGRASNPPLERLAFPPFALTPLRPGSAPIHSRARLSALSPPRPARNMAALKLLSAWPPLCASARLTRGVWSKVTCQ